MQIVTQEFMVPAGDAGVCAYSRNQRPAAPTRSGAARTALFPDDRPDTHA